MNGYVIYSLSGCANKEPPLTGVPNWNYEKDELSTLDKNILGGILGGAVGAVCGSMYGGLLGVLTQREIELSPAELHKVFENALSPTSKAVVAGQTLVPIETESPKWGIAESNKGQIITDWKEIKGKTVGLLWWKKQFHTEVRHIITIQRSYNNEKYSNFSIETQVRERPNLNYNWTKGDPELGRESFEKIKKTLIEVIRY